MDDIFFSRGKFDHLMHCYFGQDFDLFGETMEEIVSEFKDSATPEDRRMLVAEIDNFIRVHPNDLDRAFRANYGYFFCPEPWGHTTASFLTEVKRLVQA